jgi:hypothetical protein
VRNNPVRYVDPSGEAPIPTPSPELPPFPDEVPYPFPPPNDFGIPECQFDFSPSNCCPDEDPLRLTARRGLAEIEIDTSECVCCPVDSDRCSLESVRRFTANQQGVHECNRDETVIWMNPRIRTVGVCAKCKRGGRCKGDCEISTAAGEYGVLVFRTRCVPRRKGLLRIVCECDKVTDEYI